MKTPDPIQTWEAAAAALASIASALIVLFKLHLTEAQQGALTTIILTAFTLGLFVYSAWVRGSRARNAGAIAAVKTRKAAKPKPVEKKPAAEGEPSTSALLARIQQLERQAQPGPVNPPPLVQTGPATQTAPSSVLPPQNA